MHKLIDFICDELDELERKAEKEGSLTMAEVQYMDTLAHAKKNLLKSDEIIEEDYGTGMSMARGRGRNARRDATGRYSRRTMPYYRMSYDEGMKEMIDSIHDIMDDLPEDAKHDAQKFVKKLETL